MSDWAQELGKKLIQSMDVKIDYNESKMEVISDTKYIIKHYELNVLFQIDYYEDSKLVMSKIVNKRPGISTDYDRHVGNGKYIQKYYNENGICTNIEYFKKN